MEETTTDAATQEPGAHVAQPDEQPAEAVLTADSEPQQPEEEETTDDAPAELADNAEDDFDYQQWLAKKNIDPSTPEGQEQIAKSWRELEKKMHSTTQEASELKKSLGDQPATTEDERIRKLELGLAVNDWKETKGLTKAQDVAMGEYLTNNPQKNMALQYGILTLDDIYAMSGASQVGQADPATLKTQGGKEALQTLASKQRTTAPRGAASQQTAVKSDPILDVLLSD